VILVIKRFRLKEGADEIAFLEADARLQRDFTMKQPGILECTTAKSTRGEWLVVHLWESPEAADAPSARGDPVMQAICDTWVGFIDDSTATLTRYERL
jgi:hypothetical protein